MNPFQIEGPAVVSYSGGRTSAYMLRRILDEGLQTDVHVVFANTGKERIETLDFVHECQVRWGAPIHWLERIPYEGRPDYLQRFREVTYDTASREGEPFDALLEKYEYRYLPYPRLRYCTQELKIRVMKHFMRSLGYDYWDMIIGLRADEPRRVSNQRKLNGNNRERFTREMPLADAGITKWDVVSYWLDSPFDLRLAFDENGDTYEGNCDVCFLKGISKKQRIAKEHPELLAWWIDKEERAGKPFRLDQPNYLQILDTALASPSACPIDGDEMDCNCTD